MIIKDFLEFNKKKYFGGAVQANWFYETDKVNDIASSYVFHGPKFHGVSKSESTNSSYRLYDTASYALELMEKADDPSSNRFNMTIAGYGTGKSHLSVALGGLLSGHDAVLQNIVIDSIISVDKSIGDKIKALSDKNLVLIFNGMRDFNLNSEFLTVAKKALAQHGLSSDIFTELTKQYQQAIAFVKKTFENERESYDKYFAEYDAKSIDSIEAIISALEDANDAVFNAVNAVYKEYMGTYINVESDISASDILELLVNKYCIETKKFKNIYVLFDEFGRYIEFTANKPQIAGDSALQQIFEAIQNANGYVIFDAFIQSDLNSYIRRVESSNANITRYIGRYENSDKYYLSSNFETVLANLIEKKDAYYFENTVARNVESTYSSYYKNIYLYMNNWAKSDISNRNVWANQEMFIDVIAKGCYPLHPITVWFLANTSSWMQQRSTIAYTSEMFEKIQESDMQGSWLPYINPIDIIDTGLFNEMLNSEERGLVSSQYCMAYNSIIVKQGDKLSLNDKNVLKTILVINLLKFKLSDRSSHMVAMRFVSGINEEDIESSLEKLENDLCLVSFDDNTNRFDLNTEAHGKQEYSITVLKKQSKLKNYDPVAEVDEELLIELKVTTPENTSFAMDNNIASSEWQFEKRLITISQFDNDFCKTIKYHFDTAVDGEKFRGLLVYVYLGDNSDITVIQNLIREHELMQYPLIVNIIEDKEKELIHLLKRRAVLKSFSLSEKDMYARFYKDDLKNTSRSIIRIFNALTAERKILTEKKVEIPLTRMSVVCQEKFKKIYSSSIPFSFDGFEKKPTPASKKNLRIMCLNMFNGIMCNKQAYQGIDPKDKNRVQAVLSTATPTSWQVFDSKFSLCEPKNNRAKKIYTEVMEQISPDNQYIISELFKKFLHAPYGLNQYSLFLFIVYFLSVNASKIQIYDGTLPLSKNDFIQKYLSTEKKMIESILKLRISLKTQSDEDIINAVLAEVDKINNVEYCPELLQKLRQVIDNIDDISEYKGKIAIAEMKLKDGKKHYDELYNILNKAEKNIDNSKNTFSLIDTVKVLLNMKHQIVDSPIDEEEPDGFVFSEIYCRRVDKVIAEANSLLNSSFSLFVSSLKCTYAEYSEFKKNYLNVAKALNKIGKKEYSNILKNRITEVLEDVELQQKYATVLSDVHRYISQTLPLVNTLDFKSTEKELLAVNGWIDTFENADDMNASKRNEIVLKLKDIRAKVNVRISELKAYLSSVITEINNPSISISQLQERINKAILLQPDDEKSIIILKNAFNNIEDYLKYKSNFVSFDSISLSEIEREYEDKWISTVCNKYMKEWMNTIKTQIDSNRRNWMSKNVSEIRDSIDRMTIPQCIQWQTSVLEIPDYLSESDLNEVNELSRMVTQKVKAQRINGVIEMFKALSDEEKKECLNLLINQD